MADGFYDSRVAPRLVSLACATSLTHPRRKKVVSQAQGSVLEIGMGSGHNLQFYDPTKIEEFWGLEPSETMRKLANPRIRKAPFRVTLLDLPGEEIPLEDDSVDTVLSTFTMCSIPDLAAALGQMRRVLKPGGSLLFLEHGEEPSERIQRWQRRVEPAWKKVFGGCHITRQIPRVIEEAGFEIQEIESGHLALMGYVVPSLKIASFEYWGRAN